MVSRLSQCRLDCPKFDILIFFDNFIRAALKARRCNGSLDMNIQLVLLFSGHFFSFFVRLLHLS